MPPASSPPAAWGSRAPERLPPEPAALARYDFNRDGTIGVADVLVARINVGKSPPFFTTVVAPSPSLAADASTPGAAAQAPSVPTRRGAWDDLYPA
jgi:hypothetical protein